MAIQVSDFSRSVSEGARNPAALNDTDGAAHNTSPVVRHALRLIQEGALDDGSVVELARSLGIGERHLRRLFLRDVGAPPLAVARARRLHFARRLIDGTNLSMREVAVASGYRSVRRFNAAFRDHYRCTPSELRRRMAGTKLRNVDTDPCD
jgi:AraC family transcriptional regulator of adaptative response / DNA-3-methyladenine glycosylase II